MDACHPVRITAITRAANWSLSGDFAGTDIPSAPLHWSLFLSAKGDAGRKGQKRFKEEKY